MKDTLKTPSVPSVQVLDFQGVVRLLDGSNKSAKFVSLVYRAKESGELARHTILLNARRTRMLSRDLALLKVKLPELTGFAKQACQELIDSITESITTGHNSLYTKPNYYQAQGQGNCQESVKNVCYVRGYAVKKEVIEPGTYKTVNSSEKTKAKNKLRKLLKNTRCREFILNPDNFKIARAEGKHIIIDASNTKGIGTCEEPSLTRLAKLPAIAMAVPVAA
jgi:hypothetical protein